MQIDCNFCSEGFLATALNSHLSKQWFSKYIHHDLNKFYERWVERSNSNGMVDTVNSVKYHVVKRFKHRLSTNSTHHTILYEDGKRVSTMCRYEKRGNRMWRKNTVTAKALNTNNSCLPVKQNASWTKTNCWTPIKMGKSTILQPALFQDRTFPLTHARHYAGTKRRQCQLYGNINTLSNALP